MLIVWEVNRVSGHTVHADYLGGVNATPGSQRFNEIYDKLHENTVINRDTDILPDNTYTHMLIIVAKHVLDQIAMSDVLSESAIDCNTLLDVACSDHGAITVTLNFDKLPMIIAP